MRHALFCAVVLAVSHASLPVFAVDSLTVVLDFRGAHSSGSVEAMKHEVQSIMKGTGLSLDWRSRTDTVGESFEHLVVVRFKGKCILEPVAYMYDERGPLAFTYDTEGNMQPFSEVSCDRVTASVRSAMFSGDYAKADQILGRALGRVVAHELVHMLTEDRRHGKHGIAQRALTGRQLVASEMRLDSEDIQRVAQRGVRKQR